MVLARPMSNDPDGGVDTLGHRTTASGIGKKSCRTDAVSIFRERLQ